MSAPVANGRTIFELYETLQHEEYGILVSGDRHAVSVFVFDPDRYDIELQLIFDTPITGLDRDPGGGNSRLIIPDAGPRYANDPGPGVPTVSLTRAAFLSALEHEAQMNFSDSTITPVIQRLSEVDDAPRAP